MSFGEELRKLFSEGEADHIIRMCQAEIEKCGLTDEELERILDKWGKNPSGKGYDQMVAQAMKEKILEVLK